MILIIIISRMKLWVVTRYVLNILTTKLQTFPVNSSSTESWCLTSKWCLVAADIHPSWKHEVTVFTCKHLLYGLCSRLHLCSVLQNEDGLQIISFTGKFAQFKFKLPAKQKLITCWNLNLLRNKVFLVRVDCPLRLAVLRETVGDWHFDDFSGSRLF